MQYFLLCYFCLTCNNYYNVDLIIIADHNNIILLNKEARPEISVDEPDFLFFAIFLLLKLQSCTKKIEISKSLHTLSGAIVFQNCCDNTTFTNDICDLDEFDTFVFLHRA
jgi:hypothetical protein